MTIPTAMVAFSTVPVAVDSSGSADNQQVAVQADKSDFSQCLHQAGRKQPTEVKADGSKTDVSDSKNSQVKSSKQSAGAKQQEDQKDDQSVSDDNTEPLTAAAAAVNQAVPNTTDSTNGGMTLNMLAVVAAITPAGLNTTTCGEPQSVAAVSTAAGSSTAAATISSATANNAAVIQAVTSGLDSQNTSNAQLAATAAVAGVQEQPVSPASQQSLAGGSNEQPTGKDTAVTTQTETSSLKGATVAGFEVNPSSSEGKTMTADSGTQTDVKKIIDLESHRVSGGVDEVSSRTKTEAQGSILIHAPTANSNLSIPVTDNSTTQVQVKDQIDAKDLIQQIVQKTEVMSKSDGTEMKIQLKPDFLGKMTIQIAVDDGKVVAKIITSNEHVKNMLAANLDTLRQSLEANGMKVEKAEVNVQLYNDGGSFTGSDSNGYTLWSQQQQQGHANGRVYQDENFVPEEAYNPEASAPTPASYGINASGQVNFLI